jgi:hypothetical protein
MKRKLVLLLGLAVLVSAFALPGSALGGADQTVTVRMGTKKKNDSGEFRFYSPKLRAAAFGQPSLLEAGRTTFRFVNRSGEGLLHNFVIVERTIGASTGLDFATPLEAGKSGQQTVDLRPGSYIAVCTVFSGFHYSQGMIRPFTVGTLNAETGAWE